MKNFLRKLSAYLQTAKESFRKHNQKYEGSDALERERQGIEQNRRKDMLNDPTYKLGRLLEVHPEVRAVAYDIGSGTGWVSSELSTRFQKVIGIEPSVAAIAIAGKLYPAVLFPNIEWKQGFAEEVLPKMEFNEPALFVTGVVLSHLRDKEVIKICRIINEKAIVGSILCFNECWGEDWHQIRWHVRTTKWWQENLSNWKIDFHGPQIEVPGRYRGFHAIKVK